MAPQSFEGTIESVRRQLHSKKYNPVPDVRNLRAQMPLINIIARGSPQQRNQVLHDASDGLVDALRTICRILFVEHKTKLPEQWKNHRERVRKLVSFHTSRATAKRNVSGPDPYKYRGKGGGFFGWLGSKFKKMGQDIKHSAYKTGDAIKHSAYKTGDAIKHAAWQAGDALKEVGQEAAPYVKQILPMAASMAPLPPQYKIPLVMAAGAAASAIPDEHHDMDPHGYHPQPYH